MGAPDWQVAATARGGRCFPRRHWRPRQGVVHRAKREHFNLLGGASKWAISTAPESMKGQVWSENSMSRWCQSKVMPKGPSGLDVGCSLVACAAWGEI